MRILLSLAALAALSTACVSAQRKPLAFELPEISAPQASLEAAYKTHRVLSVRGQKLETETALLDPGLLRLKAELIGSGKAVAWLDEAEAFESRSTWLTVPSILALLGGLAGSIAASDNGSSAAGLGVATLGGVGLGFGLSAFPRAEAKRWMAAKEYNQALRRRLCLDPQEERVYQGMSYAQGERQARAGQSDSAKLWRFLTQK